MPEDAPPPSAPPTESAEPEAAGDAAVRTVVVEECGFTDLPIITNMDFGHTDPMFVIPYGLQTEINCDTQQITMLENAVTETVG